MAVFKLHEITPGQWPANPNPSDWLVPSPSLHRWGRRVFLYDVFSSLGPYERFKALTILILFILAVVNTKMHNQALAAAVAPSPPPDITATSHDTPATQAPRAIFYILRITGFFMLLLSFQFEMAAAIPRMRLVE